MGGTGAPLPTIILHAGKRGIRQSRPAFNQKPAVLFPGQTAAAFHQFLRFHRLSPGGRLNHDILRIQGSSPGIFRQIEHGTGQERDGLLAIVFLHKPPDIKSLGKSLVSSLPAQAVLPSFPGINHKSGKGKITTHGMEGYPMRARLHMGQSEIYFINVIPYIFFPGTPVFVIRLRFQYLHRSLVHGNSHLYGSHGIQGRESVQLQQMAAWRQDGNLPGHLRPRLPGLQQAAGIPAQVGYPFPPGTVFTSTAWRCFLE